MADIIDETVNVFASYSDGVQRKVVADALKGYKPSDFQYVREMMARDFGMEILTDYGYAGAIDDLTDVYQSLLIKFPDEILAKIPPGMIQTLQDLDMEFYFENVRDVGFELKKQLVQASIGGVEEINMKEALLKASTTLSAPQIGTLTNTSLRTMSRTAFASGAAELPKDTKFFYDGPNDDKTRDYCLQILQAGEMTRAEINSQFPGAFTNGGGFNCRHSWTPVL